MNAKRARRFTGYQYLKLLVTRKTDECIPWGRGRTSAGYGAVRAPRQRQAHRAAWELVNSRITPDICVCHHCDNPLCVNPRHLFLGTYAENNADRTAKGRTARQKGAAHGQAKLTDSDVRAIRRDRRVQRIIADKYGVSQMVISKIKRRLAWRHVL